MIATLVAPAGLNVAESYVRGCDLVATYEPRDDWPYSPQIYWTRRFTETTDQRLGSLSLFVSLQTHLLDTWPRLSIESLLETDEAFFLTRRCRRSGRRENRSVEASTCCNRTAWHAACYSDSWACR